MNWTAKLLIRAWLRFVLGLITFLPWADVPAVFAAAETLTLADRTEIALWRPPAGAKKPYPFVLFSHGIHGCRDQSSFLLDAVAARGMLVAAVNHADARCGQELTLDLPEKFYAPLTWTDATYRDRADQLHRLRAALLAETGLKDTIDPKRLILIGHSLGGYTVLGLAGARPAWRMNGVSAVIAWAPYTAPFLLRGGVENLGAPVLFDLGNNDTLITPVSEKVYARAPSPACLALEPGANHFAWVEPDLLPDGLAQPELADEVTATLTAYLDRIASGTATGPFPGGTCR